MIEHELAHEITADTVRQICADLDQAVEGDVIVIHMPYNNGGEVDAAIDLLDSILETKAEVWIEIDRYVASAAAFIYCWFYFKPVEHVRVRTRGLQALIIYHRPRMCISQHIAFLDGLNQGDPYYDYLKHHTDLFDGLFDVILSEFGYQESNGTPYPHQGSEYTHELHHMKLSYYSNQDCVFPA
jgi:hypothetical protein